MQNQSSKFKVVKFRSQFLKQEIPTDWLVDSIKKVSSKLAVGFVGTCDPYYTGHNGIPMIRTTNVKEGHLDLTNLKYVTREFHEKNKKSKLNIGDLLVARHGENGRACLFRGLNEANCLSVVIVRPEPSLWVPAFFEMAFNSNIVRKQISRSTGGGVQTVVNTSEIGKALIFIPPLHEQGKIASIISTVDELIQKTDLVIEQTQRLKKGLMQRLLTKGIGHIKFRSSPLGSIPDGWEIVRLEDITTISTGSTPSTFVLEYYDGEIPFIRTAEIVNRIITDSMLRVSKRAVNECSMNIYPPKTVFLAMYGQGKTRGQSALLNIHATTSQNTAAIVANEVKLDAVYLWQYLLFSYNRLRGEGNIGYISHLNLNFVKKFSIPLPPINEQKKVVLILSQIDNKIEKRIQIRNKIYDLKKGLLQKLLTGKIRVKV